MPDVVPAVTSRIEAGSRSQEAEGALNGGTTAVILAGVGFRAGVAGEQARLQTSVDGESGAVVQ